MRMAKLLIAMVTILGAILGPTIASGQTEIHVVAEYSRITPVDIHEDGTLGPGDLLASRGPALDGAGSDRVGSVYWECMVQRAVDGNGLLVCDAVLTLEDGEIMMRGLDPQGAGETPFAVTGGTGAYGGAQGDGTWTDTETGTGWVTDIVIHLAA